MGFSVAGLLVRVLNCLMSTTLLYQGMWSIFAGRFILPEDLQETGLNITIFATFELLLHTPGSLLYGSSFAGVSAKTSCAIPYKENLVWVKIVVKGAQNVKRSCFFTHPVYKQES